MLRKLNFTLLPTKSDVLWVNNEIRMTERKLKDLERDMEMLKAWIAPIRRLNTDILSLVFEICGEDDWKMPLNIAATSRDWRNLVLATPRAWEFLPGRECQDINITRLFLERSDPRPLHFYHRDLSGTSLLSSISHRLECLTLEDFHGDMGTLSFPNLRRLVIACEDNVQISRIDAARFPALRHLAFTDHIWEAPPFVDGDLLSLPPLLSLSLTIGDELIWLSVLQACQDTLISLALIAEVPTKTMHGVQLVFPRLMSLEIDRWGRPERWPLYLKTPVLETYIEKNFRGQSGILIQADFKTITQLRTDRELDSLMFPKVQLIQFTRHEEASLLLHRLLANPAHCLELETIEVEMTGRPAGHMIDLVAAVNRKLERAISLVFTTELSDLQKTQLCG